MGSSYTTIPYCPTAEGAHFLQKIGESKCYEGLRVDYLSTLPLLRATYPGDKGVKNDQRGIKMIEAINYSVLDHI